MKTVLEFKARKAQGTRQEWGGTHVGGILELTFKATRRLRRGVA